MYIDNVYINNIFVHEYVNYKIVIFIISNKIDE